MRELLVREVGRAFPLPRQAFNEQAASSVCWMPSIARRRAHPSGSGRLRRAHRRRRRTGAAITHLDEVERVLKTGGASGKRLDFLMQELNREANTLASKSLVAEVSQTAMELKLLIEQMREQVQNLE
jgi:hypothetical protein